MFIDTWYKNTNASLPWIKCQTNITENYMISVYVVSKGAETPRSLWAPLLFQRIIYPGKKRCKKTKNRKGQTKPWTQENEEYIMLVKKEWLWEFACAYIYMYIYIHVHSNLVISYWLSAHRFKDYNWNNMKSRIIYEWLFHSLYIS